MHTMKRIHLHLTDNQLDRLRTLADRSGLNVAELVRRALDSYLCIELASDPINRCGPALGLDRIDLPGD